MVKLELKKAIGAAVFFALFNTTNAAGLPDFSSLVEDYGATVVNITGERISGESNADPVPENDPFYDWYRRFGPQEPRGQQSVSRGSGFVLGEDGYIITNEHVFANTSKIFVKLIDKR